VRKRHLLGLTLSCLVLIAGGCGNNYDPVHYVNSIKQITRTWTVDAEMFGKLIKTETDPARLQAGQRELANRIKTLVAESGKIRVPSTKEAQELWNAFQTYLKNQQRMVTDDFQELVAIKTDPGRDMEYFRSVVGRCKEVEDADLARLRKAETAFEQAHGFATR